MGAPVNAQAPPADHLVARGFADHRAGRLAQAEAAYRQALVVQPAHADALHFLGLIAHQCGDNQAAAEHIGRAIASNSANPSFYCNLGLILSQLGRPAEAEANLRTALRLRPEFPEALNSLGIALYALGRRGEAEASYRQALRLKPDFADAWNNLGIAAASQVRPAEAEASYREALRLNPAFADAHANLGIVLAAQDRPAEAEASYRQALRLRPEFPAALTNLGATLTVLGRAAEAEACFREVVRLRPGFAEAHSNLAVALCDLRRHGEAQASAREAVRLDPDYADAHCNLGMALFDLCRLDEAEASYRRALSLNPALPQAHMNLSSALLISGRFEEGWSEHEWRWKTRNMASGLRDFPVPLWGGEPIGGRTILLHAEQGLGDTLQFCRYAPLIEPGAGVILEVQAPLARLVSRMPGVAQVVVRGQALPPFDLHCPLLSLPRAFRTTLATIPGDPYLVADPGEAASWRGRLAGLPGLKIGLVWAGEPRTGAPELAAIDARRSMALATLAPLAEVSAVSFVSLQKGKPAAQAADPPTGMTLTDFTADLHDFADTAALIENLDLVISVDTSVAHLAGAMGKPVWLLNRFDTCWRWLLDRDDSPWYPSLRQFRQPTPGDWPSVIEGVRDALHRLAAGDQGQFGPPAPSPTPASERRASPSTP